MKIKNNRKSAKLIIIILLVTLVTCLGLVYVYKNYLSDSQTTAPSSERTNTPEALPTIKSKSNAEESPSNIPESSTVTPPTKTEGKTPTQYEGEKVDDTPAYNNEQFRIPEENM